MSSAGLAALADCDADGKFTSYLSDQGNDLIQPKTATESKQQWMVQCEATSPKTCKVQAVRSKLYLGTSAAGTLTLVKTAPGGQAGVVLT